MRLIWEKIGRPTPLTLLPSIRISARSTNWFSINNAPDVYFIMLSSLNEYKYRWFCEWIWWFLGRRNLLSTSKIRSRVTEIYVNFTIILFPRNVYSRITFHSIPMPYTQERSLPASFRSRKTLIDGLTRIDVDQLTRFRTLIKTRTSVYRCHRSREQDY